VSSSPSSGDRPLPLDRPTIVFANSLGDRLPHLARCDCLRMSETFSIIAMINAAMACSEPVKAEIHHVAIIFDDLIALIEHFEAKTSLSAGCRLAV